MKSIEQIITSEARVTQGVEEQEVDRQNKS